MFFKPDFIQHELNESILDFPKESLCQSIWTYDANNEIILTPYAKSRIMAVVQWMQQRFQIPNMGANLTGSITSNSYGQNSDIDIHFNSKNVKSDKADEFTKLIRTAFEEEFKRDFPEFAVIDEHPIEVYFQKNVFQDLMSVGCYDIINEEWLVGPEMHSTKFDPYSEYYSDDMRHVDDIIDSIRSVIMESYEKSLVLLKSKDAKFRHTIEKQFLKSVAKGAKLFTKLRKHRILSSSPKNVEDAMKKRSSKEWKIADSSFKLLDKFGYTAILKAITVCFENKDSDEFDFVESALSIVKAVNDNLSMTKIDDSEQLDESILGTIGRYGALATMLAVPGILPAKQIQMGFKQVQAHKQLSQNSQEFQDMMTDLMKDEQMFGIRDDHMLPAAKLANALAWSMMREAENQFKKYGRISFDAIASTILNRAGGDPNYFIEVISASRQFSEWNDYKGGWTNDTYDMLYPKNLTNPTVSAGWNVCTNIASDMILGQYKSVIGNCNMIANPKRDGLGALRSWGYACDLQIGDHFFGYQPDQDGWRKAGKKCPTPDSTISDDQHIVFWNKTIHTVQSGDTLSTIAKKYGTTIDMIQLVNAGLVTSKLQVNQKIAIPFTTDKSHFIASSAERLQISKMVAKAKDDAKAKAKAKAKAGTTTVAKKQNNSSSSKVVVVQAGDSLIKIAKANGTSVASILSKNKGLKINSTLHIGQKLNV